MNLQHNTESPLRMLRTLVPRRRLTHGESLRIAELQANRLLETFEIEGVRVPSELVSEFPRVAVRYEHDLPVSGSTHWEAGLWIITLNADESSARRRFSLMHEFKHILDHTTKHYLYGNTDEDERAADRAERVADYFAACLLMPKRSLKRLWFENRQQLTKVAMKLGVSTRALSVRLYYLGLAPETRRCSRHGRAYERPTSIRERLYFRFTPVSEAVV